MKVLVREFCGGMTFKESVNNVYVIDRLFIKMSRMLGMSEEELELCGCKACDGYEVIEYYEDNNLFDYIVPEELAYTEEEYIVDGTSFIIGYITNDIKFLENDIFSEMKKGYLVIDESEGIRHRLYNKLGEVEDIE